MRSNARIYGWGFPGNLFLGQHTGDGDLMRRRFRVGCGCFFLGGAGEGKRSSRARFAEKFSQNGGLQTDPILCYILYVEQWKFSARGVVRVRLYVISVIYFV